MNTIPAKILIIDDEFGMREGCRRALMPHGYQVSTAEHGADGLRKMRERGFDLVLLDAMMPGMSGLELLERILEYDSDISCIMITGYATVDLAARAMKQGAHDFLPKPFTSDELLTAVNRGVEERRVRLQRKQQQVKAREQLELERARQEIAKLDAIESRFMLVLVHELRNPAGVIKNISQLMRGGYLDEDEWDEYVERLDLRAGQMLDMLDNLLELANLKGQRTPSKLTPISVADVLESVVRRHKPQADSKGLDLSLEINDRPLLYVRESHLRSLWTNLLRNALQYTKQGQVQVTLTYQDGQMQTSVSDTGIGMSNEDLARIFEEFFRSETAKECVPLGTGLGLAIVDQIVSTYGGSIEVESVLGEGSTLAVTLPLETQSEGQSLQG